MRYMTADSVVFTDAVGRTVTIKDTIPMVGKSDRSFEVPCFADIALDEVATRQEAYGDNAEASAYLIFEENAVEIMEARMDMGKIKKLRVPF